MPPGIAYIGVRVRRRGAGGMHHIKGRKTNPADESRR